MPDQPSDSREFGKLMALAQVGFETAAPIAIGLVVDNHYDTGPWGVVLGVIVGLVGGLWHLIVLAKRFDDPDAPKKPRNSQ